MNYKQLAEELKNMENQKTDKTFLFEASASQIPDIWVQIEILEMQLKKLNKMYGFNKVDKNLSIEIVDRLSDLVSQVEHGINKI